MAKYMYEIREQSFDGPPESRWFRTREDANMAFNSLSYKFSQEFSSTQPQNSTEMYRYIISMYQWYSREKDNNFPEFHEFVEDCQVIAKGFWKKEEQ